MHFFMHDIYQEFTPDHKCTQYETCQNLILKKNLTVKMTKMYI